MIIITILWQDIQTTLLQFLVRLKWQMLFDSLAASMLPLNVIHDKLPHSNQNFCTNFHHKLFFWQHAPVAFFGFQFQ